MVLGDHVGLSPHARVAAPRAVLGAAVSQSPVKPMSAEQRVYMLKVRPINGGPWCVIHPADLPDTIGEEGSYEVEEEVCLTCAHQRGYAEGVKAALEACSEMMTEAGIGIADVALILESTESALSGTPREAGT